MKRLELKAIRLAIDYIDNASGADGFLKIEYNKEDIKPYKMVIIYKRKSLRGNLGILKINGNLVEISGSNKYFNEYFQNKLK